MSKYLGKGKMIPGIVEEEILDSSWKIWSIGFDGIFFKFRGN